MSLFGELCARCGNARTEQKLNDAPLCEECRLALEAHREDRCNCPECGCEMRKLIVQVVIVDKCPTCHGVWLDAGELELLQQAIQRESKYATGVLAGIVLG